MVDIAKNRSVSRAVQLIEVGLRSPIVVLDTGLPETSIRSIARQMKENRRAPSGSLPSVTNIARTKSDVVELSLLAVIYERLGGKYIYDSIDLDCLIEAHSIYSSVRVSLGDCMSRQPVDINCAWVLARSMRSDEVWLRKCKKCTATYIAFPCDKQVSGCPFCQIASRSTKTTESRHETDE